MNDSLIKIVNGVEMEPNYIATFGKNHKWETTWVPLTAERKNLLKQAEVNRGNYKSQFVKKSTTVPTKSKWIPNKYKSQQTTTKK